MGKIGLFVLRDYHCMKNGRWSYLLGICLFLFLSSVSVAAAPTASYFYKVAEDGETTAVITLSGEGTIILPLPQDVVDPEIRGGVYVLAPEGIEVTVGESGKTQIGYASSFHTRKEAGIWYFEATLEAGSSAKLALPLSVQLVQARPSAKIGKDSYRELTWNQADKLDVSYIIKKEEPAAGDGNTLPQSVPLLPTLLITAAIILIVLGGGYYYFKKGKKAAKTSTPVNENKPESTEKKSENEEKAEKEDLPNITDAQMNVIKAANENDALIITTLMKNNGKMKRNTLEKETNLAKSSLASALSGLEKKNLVKVDRTFHIHYITLSQWFRELK